MTVCTVFVADPHTRDRSLFGRSFYTTFVHHIIRQFWGFREYLNLSLPFLQASQAFLAYVLRLSLIGLWNTIHRIRSGDTGQVFCGP
jgi:hypothetical protein